MTTTNRAALINKLQKALKRSYKHTPTKGDQPLLETLLFASVLENARYETAKEAFAKVRSAFFDWNEIRVSTAKELAEVMSMLPDALGAATRLKGILQSVFESDYSFELEHLKKQNIGAAVKKLEKLSGATPFVVAYGTQNALGGHSIPLDQGTLGAMYVIGAMSESEKNHGSIPGLERAIPKSKGQEFGALLHELGADFFHNPFSTSLREQLLAISPDAKDRFPKRAPKKPPAPEPVKAAPVDSKKKVIAVTKKPAGKVAEKKPAHPPKAVAQPKKKAGGKKMPAKTLVKRKPR